MSTRLHSGLLALLLLPLMGSVSIAGDRMEKLPAELEGVTLIEKPGDALALDSTFVNEVGTTVRLADLIKNKPIILTFNYTDCPMLCSLQLDGLVDSLSKMEWSVGTEFEIITISLDPKESKVQSRETKARYLERYDRPNADLGWHFLTGTEDNIKKVAESVGFGYRYHSGRKEFLHPAVLTLVSPRGNVSGYMSGVEYDPIAVRDRLIVAKVGEISESLTEFILSCYHYESATGRGAVIKKIMSYSALAFVCGFGTLAFFGFRRSHMDEHSQRVGSTEDHV